MHVAVVGSGGWSRPHLAALSASPLVSQITLVGRRESTLAALEAEFATIRSSCGSLEAMLNDPSVDLVDVVLPHHLHFQVSEQSLSAGKHVICEKPSSLSLADFDKLQARAAAAERRFLVVMNQLYSPLVGRIGQLLDGGAIGRPFLLVENNYSQHAAAYRDGGWRTRLATCGGGVLIDGGYHMVYKHLDWLARQGYPDWVQAVTAQLAIDPQGVAQPEQGEDFVSYTAGYAEPLRINASHAWTLAADPSRPRLGLLAGSDATLEWTCDPKRPLMLHRAGSRPEGMEVEGAGIGNAELLHACLTDYLSAVAEQRPTAFGSTELARRTLQLILAIYESATVGQRVDL